MKTFLSIFLLLIFFPLHLFSFGKNKVNYHHHDWTVLISPHYRLYLPSDRLFLSNEVVGRAERIFDHHSKIFGYSPSNRIRVIIYPNQIDFQQNNIIPGWIGEGTGGVTEFVKGRVVLPYSARGDYFQHVFAHELTHVFQGVRWGHGRMSQNTLKQINVPLWMIEGMAEYNSLGIDPQCETMIADGILSGNLPNLLQLSDLSKLKPSQYYFIYKEGQFFYYFLESTFGTNLIAKINDSIMLDHNTEAVISNSTGMTLANLNDHFMDFVRRKYLTAIKNLSTPDIAAHKLIEKPSRMNMSPLALDEDRTAFISDRKLLPSILIYNRKNKNLSSVVTGGFNENYLEFHFGEKAHLSVSSNTLCFVSRSGGDNRIHLFDLKTHKDRILNIPYKMIQSPDISSDGKQVLFSAMDKDHFDIFLMDITSKKITRITDDKSYDNEPRWINNSTIVFSSGRFYPMDSPQSDLLIINLSNKQILKRINTGYRDVYPTVSRDGSKLAFTSESVHPTLYVYQFANHKLFRQFAPTGGAYAPTFTPAGDLIFTAYHKGLYNLYRFTPTTNTPAIGFVSQPNTNTLRETAHFLPAVASVKPYFPEFSIDNLFGGFTFNSDLGIATLGMIDLSDLMGNHRARLILDSSIRLTNFKPDYFNADLSYFYLKERLDIGFRLYHYSNYFYQLSTFQTFFDIEKPYTHTWAALFLLSYPFSTFDRLESRIGIKSFDFVKSIETTSSNTYIIHTFPQDRPLIDIAFVHDSTLNDITGPVNGSRYQVSLSASLPLTEHSVSYLKLIADYRSYFYLLPGYSFAFRAVGGRTESSDTNALFHLGGFNSLRGYDLWSFSGNVLGLINLEFRFPLIMSWKIGFPFQIPMPTIWGTMFIDLGTAFTAGNPSYQPWVTENNIIRLKDWHCGVGAGLRVVLVPGIKMIADWAVPYDLTGIKLSTPWKSTFQIGIDF